MIGGFRSDMSITRKIDGNFWKRFRECFVFQSRVSTKTVVMDPVKATLSESEAEMEEQSNYKARKRTLIGLLVRFRLQQSSFH